MSGKALYIGWVDQGNLGDDLCRDIFIREIQNTGGGPWTVEAVSPQYLSANYFVHNRPDLVVLGGGSLIHPYYLVPLLWAQEHDIPTVIWGSGVDGSPPEVPAKIERGESLEGFCLKPGKKELIRHVVSCCARVGVRGPHTYSYLRSLGCSGPLEISGDPGLLLREPVSARGHALLESEAPIVGVNWGTTGNNVYGGSEKEVARQLTKVVQELALDHKVILFAVWPPDLLPLKQLAAAAGGSKNIALCEAVPSTPFLTSLLKACLFTVNFKLHANVFTAAMGNPFISLGYRSKCFDFAASLAAGELIVSTGADNLAEKVLALSRAIKADLDRYRHKISVKRNHYREKLLELTGQIGSGLS